MPPSLRVGDPIWRACTSLISFDTIEWHHADRVLRQFGYHQHIPQDPTLLDELHTVDMRGKPETKWHKYHRVWLQMWKTRRQRVAGERPYGLYETTYASREYYLWYWRETMDHLFLTGVRHLQVPHSDLPAVVDGLRYNVPVPPPQTGRRKRRVIDDAPSESDEDVSDDWQLRSWHCEQHHGYVDPQFQFPPAFGQFHPAEPSMPQHSPYFPQQSTPRPYFTEQQPFGYVEPTPVAYATPPPHRVSQTLLPDHNSR